MTILSTTSLESNKRIKIYFNGGDLSSDAGLLLISEFASKVGLTNLVNRIFKTNDTASFRFHVIRIISCRLSSKSLPHISKMTAQMN